MDSTGLGVLVGRLKQIRLNDGSMKLVCAHDRVLKVFVITGLDKVFAIYPTVERGRRRRDRVWPTSQRFAQGCSAQAGRSLV